MIEWFEMRLKILIILLFSFSFFSLTCATNSRGDVSKEHIKEIKYYRIDDGYITSGGRSADNMFFLVDVYFSFELVFESQIDEWDKRSQAFIAKGDLSIVLMNYIHGIFLPMFTMEDLDAIIKDKENTLFLKYFTEYIKDNKDLNNVKIINIKIELLGITY